MRTKDILSIGLVAFLLFALCFLLPSVAFSQGKITYMENFVDNNNGWWIGENSEVRAEIKNGKYIIERKTNKVKNTIDITWKPWFFWPTSRIKIDRNRLFRIDSNMKFLGGNPEDEFGVVLGAADGASYYRFSLTAKGKCGHSFFHARKTGQRDVFDICPVNKGHAENKISVGRIDDGSGIAFILNEKQTKIMQFAAFELSEYVGLHLDGQMAVEVEDFKILVASSGIPTGWSVVNIGNFSTKAVWDNPTDASKFRTEIHKGSELTIKAPVVGNNVSVSVNVNAPPAAQESSAGILIRTEDGGLLKMERVDTPRGIVAKFSAMAGDEPMGSREVPIQAGEVRLVLTRQKDSFRGEVTSGGKTIALGPLNWPNLSQKQEAGVIAIYKADKRDGQPSLTYNFSNFTLNPSTAIIKTKGEVPAREKPPSPAAMPKR